MSRTALVRHGALVDMSVSKDRGSSFFYKMVRRDSNSAQAMRYSSSGDG